MSPTNGDIDISAVASVMGNPARGFMLTALLGGYALPASELAKVGGVAPSTASAHLAQLVAVNLVTVEDHGRHRYYRLANEHVAQAIESIAAIAPRRPVYSLREGNKTKAERFARSCYDHLAGEVAVKLADRLCEIGAIHHETFELLDSAAFQAVGVDINRLGTTRRPVTRRCHDWSERRPHLAGELGANLLQVFLENKWVLRRPSSRALSFTPAGEAGLLAALGLCVRQ